MEHLLLKEDNHNMWFWLALTSALVSGVSVTFNKRVLNRGVHSSVVAFAIFTVVTLITFPLMLLNKKAETDSVFFMAAVGSALVFSVAKIIGLNIFKHNNLTDVYPLAAMAPVTLYIMSVIFLSENIKQTAVFGIILMAAGVYILNFSRSNKNYFHPIINFFKNRYSILYLCAIILSNISAVFEKIAMLHTEGNSVYPLAFWENLFLSAITGAYVVKTNKSWFTEIKNHISGLTIAGVLFAILYLVVIFGFRDGPVALISAIKKLEVLVVIIISYIFFKERPSKKIYIASFLMLLAVLLIKI